MFKVLIFAGTTEGRMLAEFCCGNKISADVSAATEYGASLLPKGAGILSGRLDSRQITALLKEKKYDFVIDATHPYAAEATQNIKKACAAADVPYYRLLRETVPIFGEAAESIEETVETLNRDDSVILSTLGSKTAAALTDIQNYRERVWLRILPDDENLRRCIDLGYDENKLISEKGPFGVEQNIAHIKKSGADILLTKESGSIGGYPEKAEAVRQCGIHMLTLRRPPESGYKFEEMTELIINKHSEKQDKK